MTAQMKLYLAAMAVAAIAAVGFVIYWNASPAPWETAPESPQLRQIDNIDLVVPKIRVYAPKAKKALQLPPEVQSNPDKHVVSAIDCGDKTAVTVIDQRTGETDLLIQKKPLPWMAFERHGQVRLDYGSNGTRQITRLSIQQDLIQVKALHGGISATLDSDRAFFVGIGGGVKW